MKAKYILGAIVATLLSLTATAQPRIAVLDFNAGAGVIQNDVNGLSAIFNTNFTPAGYTIVERTRVTDVLREQNIQVSSMTEEQRVRLGEILNVAVIVIGDVNIVMQQYNVDVRAVNVETGAIIAKDGIEIVQGASYREVMKTLAERLAQNLPIVEFAPRQLPTVKTIKTDPVYRQTGGAIKFSLGFPTLLSLAYNHQITPSFMAGGGLGLASKDGEHGGMPIFLETELRTPRLKWSVFANLKVGIHYEFTGNIQPFAGLAAGISHKNLHLGMGFQTLEYTPAVNPLNYLVLFFSYNLPLNTIKKGLY